MELTQRSLNILEARKFFIVSDSKKISNPFVVRGDKKLTVTHYEVGNLLRDLIYESICILLDNREADKVIKLNFKEFDSFLRDNNSLSAFGDELKISAEEFFNESKKFLIISWLKEFYQSNQLQVQEDFVNKLVLVDSIFDNFLSCFQLDQKFKLEFVEHEFVYYFKNSKVDFNFVEEAFAEFLSEIYNTKINFVAVKG